MRRKEKQASKQARTHPAEAVRHLAKPLAEQLATADERYFETSTDRQTDRPTDGRIERVSDQLKTAQLNASIIPSGDAL